VKRGISPRIGQRISRPPPDHGTSTTPLGHRLTIIFTVVIQMWLAVGLIFFIARRDWENASLTVAVIGLATIPVFVLRRYRVCLPSEFQLIVAAFVFVSLFLGSARDFYCRFWWWDIVLHISSGFLLGIVGWIAMFLLNHTDHLPRGIRPGFLCLFGVTFAVFLGVLWEIFEYAVDLLWPAANMMSNETGVADTMQDLIVNTVGAVLVGLMGWAYSRSGKYSYLVDAVRAFMRMNPRWFRRSARRRKRSAAGKLAAISIGEIHAAGLHHRRGARQGSWRRHRHPRNDSRIHGPHR
jgi:hypothetical protein